MSAHPIGMGTHVRGCWCCLFSEDAHRFDTITAPVGKHGWCCCLLPAVLPVVWLLAAALLPGEVGEAVGWAPVWLVAVLWNGEGGQGGISHLLG